MLIFCKSKRAAERTLANLIPYIEKKLFLKVNREKTEVAYVGKVKFLGYAFYINKNKDAGLRVHPKSAAKMKVRIRQITSRSNGMGYERRKLKLKQFITGWVNYFKLADMKNLLKRTDQWLRRRIRMVIWKQWERVSLLPDCGCLNLAATKPRKVTLAGGSRLGYDIGKVTWISHKNAQKQGIFDLTWNLGIRKITKKRRLDLGCGYIINKKGERAMRRKSFVLVIMLVLLMVAIVGCGDTDEEIIDTDEAVIDTDTKPETPPEVQANPLVNYELISSEQLPGPEGAILSVSAYTAPTGATATAVLEDFGQWAEEEGWSVLIPADAEELGQVFRMLVGDSFEQDYYKKGNEAMLIGVLEAEAEDKLVIIVMAGLPLSEFE